MKSIPFAAVLAVLSGPAFGAAFETLAAASNIPRGGTLENLTVNMGAPFTGAGISGGVPVRGGGTAAAALKAPDSGKAKAKAEEPPPPRSDEERRTLKKIRAGGLVAAGAGAGLMVYAAVAAASGPVGWAAALIFFGGMAAYLAHRRLNGHDDFHP